MNKVPRVCVIILSWNHKKDVLETVKSLSVSDTKGFEMDIWDVDNGSSDGTPEALEKLPIKLIRLKENFGFAKGNNIGMSKALREDFDYVALLNDDTIVDRALVKKILSEHKKYKNAGAISPKIYFAKGYEFHKEYKDLELGKVVWYAGGKLDRNNIYGTNYGVDSVDRGQFNKTTQTDFATGCFVMYKARALKEVGLYDERYFAYLEDADHAQRMKEKGWDVMYSPKGVLWHKVSQSSGIGSGLNDYYLTRNRMLFGMKYASLRTKFALFRESIKLLLSGRQWQKIGIGDYYLGRLGKGSWK